MKNFRVEFQIPSSILQENMGSALEMTMKEVT
jgi:hypothetical protein